MKTEDINILHKSLLINLGGSFEVYEEASFDTHANVFSKILSFITFEAYIPTIEKLMIVWYVNGYKITECYPESCYHYNSYTLDEMRNFIWGIIEDLKEEYKNRPKQKETNKMEKTMKQEIEDLKKEITRLQTIITELETKTTYPTETELYTNDLYNPNSYKTYPTHAVNYEDYQK